MVDPNGDRFMGVFKNGDFLNGTLITIDGGIFEGKFKDNKLHGKGTAIIPDKAIYKGDFFNGNFNGNVEGRIEYPNGDIAIGLFNKNNELHGPNGYQKKNGVSFKGPFRHGKLHGRGVVTDPDGTRYSGNFKEGLAHMLMKIVTLPDGSEHRVLFFGGEPYTGIVNDNDLEYAVYLEGTKYFTFDESFGLIFAIALILMMKKQAIQSLLIRCKTTIDTIQNRQKKLTRLTIGTSNGASCHTSITLKNHIVRLKYWAIGTSMVFQFQTMF